MAPPVTSSPFLIARGVTTGKTARPAPSRPANLNPMIGHPSFLRITIQTMQTASNEKDQEAAVTKKEVSKFRKVLEVSVMEFDGSTRQRDAIVIEGSADELDRGLRATERELAVRNLEAVSAKQREAREALRRIQQGAYGVCLDCEEAISPARLAALPWAALCIRCQETVDCGPRPKNGRLVFPMAA